MRLTKRNADGIACSAKPFEISTFDMLDKLAAYEDTGLSPEEFRERTESVLELYEKLKPYADAEEQGRLLILPCKVGDTVYRIIRHRIDVSGYRMEWEWETVVEAVLFRIGMLDAIGKTVFLTREEAEAALKGGRDDGT